MSWNSVTASTATWVAGSSTAKTWSGQTIAAVPPPWAMLQSVVSSDDGVDFRLWGRDAYILWSSNSRPLTAWNIQPEGQP